MESRKKIWYFTFLLVLGVLVVGCGSPGGTQGSGSGSAKSITFWAASNPSQQAFWTGMAKDYMAQHKDITVTVRPIPESPTSEAGIQAALAGGSAPAASENIFTGFAGQLTRDKALVPLDSMPGWSDLIKARHMDQSIQGWKFDDGHNYVLPIYSNAMLFGWRMDILKQIGYDKPPQTYSDIIAMGQKLKQKFPDKFVWARDALAKNTWYERWFDFFMLYDAASGGKSFINGSKVTADDQAATGVLGFFQNLAQKKLLLTQTVNDPFENGVSVMDVIGPWRFTTWAQKYPTLKLNNNYVLTPPPVPDGYTQGQAVKTFADTKGIVIYKQASPDAQAAVWDFVKWVFSDEQHDSKWLQTTSLPPARDDLGTNPTFKAYFDQHPELEAFAQNVPNAIPPIKSSKYTDIQVSLGDDAVVPVVNGQKTPDKAWSDWKTAVQPLLG